MKLTNWQTAIAPLDERAMLQAQARWDNIAKPLHSLGKLEDLWVKIAGITANAHYTLNKRAVVVMCADNGVVAQEVTQTGAEITALVARNLTKGTAAVSYFARKCGAEVWPVDVGVAAEVAEKGILNCKVAYGSKDITQGPAMSREEAVHCLEIGAEMASRLKGQGYHIVCVGEMGIGNTTTASAVTAALLKRSPEEVTGRGAGLSAAGLARKTAVIAQALAINQPNGDDGVDVLSKVGGFDLAAMAGLYLGCAAQRLPVVIDGVISAAAALAAARIAPPVTDYLLPSHLSKEPAAALILQALGLDAPLRADLALGEGTGAVLLLPLLDAAGEIYHHMESFAEMEMAAYQPFEEETC